MMPVKKYFIYSFGTFILLSFFTISVLFAQTKNELEMIEMEAKNNFENFRYHLALPDYIKLNQAFPQEISYKYFIADCYIHMDNDKMALPYFEECLKLADKFPASIYYYAGRTYHLAERYKEAIQVFNKYIALLSRKKNTHAALIEEVNREIDMCLYAQELTKNPLDVKIVNLGKPINSEFAEYAPVISGDQNTLMFTSTRPTTTGGKTDDADGEYFEDIYVASRTDSGYSMPDNIGASINSAGHDASISLSADGQKLLFYRYGNEHLEKATSGDLFISELYGKKWTPAAHLSHRINSDSWEPSASFTTDEKIMYFSSDRPGGFGGTDIYYVEHLAHGEWAAPVNLGPTINTAHDEDSPFMHPDGKTLYFSSNGHKSMGGYDIFVATFDEANMTWSKPENFGYPINTPHDDLHFSWSADGTRVYFSSIRPEGYGDRDLYYADIKKSPAEVMIIKGMVLDSSSSMPVDSKIYVKEKSTSKLTEICKSNSDSGKYLVLISEGKNYLLTAEAEGYRPYTETIDIADVHKFQEKVKNIYLVKR